MDESGDPSEFGRFGLTRDLPSEIRISDGSIQLRDHVGMTVLQERPSDDREFQLAVRKPPGHSIVRHRISGTVHR